MSLNTLLEQRFLPELESLQVLLVKDIGRWSSAQTQEDRDLIEANIVETFRRLLYEEEELSKVMAGENPSIDDLSEYNKLYSRLASDAFVRVRKLAEQYLKYFNTQRIGLLELTGKLRRIRQKQATISLMRGDKARYVVSENFLVLDQLATNQTSEPEAFVDTYQGALMLPIRSSKKLSVSKVVISGNSNGFPGNSDSQVSLTQSNPTAVLGGDPETWFEYERLDNGPLVLVLMFELGTEQVVNQVSIEPLVFGGSLPFRVEDITYSSTSLVSKLNDLISPDVDRETLVVSPNGNDVFWTLNHLPTRAKTITIKLVQNSAYQVKAYSDDKRLVSRKRYAVGLKNVEFYRNEFMVTGGINSTEIPLPGNLYLLTPRIEAYPAKQRVYGMKLDVSLDGGQTWKEDITATDESSVLMDGTEKSLIWRTVLDRKPDEFTKLTSFSDERIRYETGSILRSVSKFLSPTVISLPQKPSTPDVFCIQPQLMRRGDQFAATVAGSGVGDFSKVQLPFSVLKAGLDPDDLRVMVNNRTLDRVDDRSDVTAGTWAYSADFREIFISDNVRSGARIRVFLEQEQMSLEEKSDGFYHRMKLMFDPDPETISIMVTPKTDSRRSVVLPKTRKIVAIGSENLSSEGIELSSSEGNTYTEVSSVADLVDSSTYYLDRVNGIIHFGDVIGNDDVKLTFQHNTPVKLDSSLYEVVYDGAKPWGIRVDRSVLGSHSVEERVGGAITSFTDIRSGESAARRDYFSANTKTKTLSHPFIVKGTVSVSSNLFSNPDGARPREVPFIDGYSEFLGLIEMNKEETVEISASPGQSTVSFNLSAGSLWHKPLGASFSTSDNFGTSVATASLVGSLGEYHISTSGRVTVWVGLGGTLPSGTKISYLYRNVGFDPSNKYSVDYESGVLYSYSAMNPLANIRYKVAPMKVSYDVAEEVRAYTYDQAANSVEIKTELLRDVNNLVKVIWTKPLQGRNLEGLQNYFSPVISRIGFRFN